MSEGKRYGAMVLVCVGGVFLLAVLACGARPSVVATSNLQTVQAQTSAPATQDVTIDFRTGAGGLELHASSVGKNYSINPTRLSFTAFPHDKPGSRAHPLVATISTPEMVPLIGLGAPPDQRPKEFRMEVTFPRPPGPPGMYDVQLHAAKDFGRTEDGGALELGNQEVLKTILIWWPDESNNDAAIASLRSRFVGKSVFGYGGISIECAPARFKAYYATTPVRVRAVERDRERVAELWTGATTHWGNDAAPHFFANDPVRFIVDLPSVGAASEGGSSIEGGMRPCP